MLLKRSSIYEIILALVGHRVYLHALVVPDLSPKMTLILVYLSNVRDIHSVLEVTVYDEDRDHKVEFLGRVAVPLLKIVNGERKWSVGRPIYFCVFASTYRAFK